MANFFSITTTIHQLKVHDSSARHSFWLKIFLILFTGESFRYDRSFRGPLANRSCTDVFFLLLFFVFLIAFGFAGYYAQREGDLNKLLVPRDSEGYQCGQDSEVIDQKYLFFFDLSKCADPLVPINGCKTPQVCVKECPKKTFFHDMSQCNSQGVANYKKDLICTRQVDLSLANSCGDINKLMEDGKCSKWYLKSEPCKYNEYCMKIWGV